jgi:hypothetical protein
VDRQGTRQNRSGVSDGDRAPTRLLAGVLKVYRTRSPKTQGRAGRSVKSSGRAQARRAAGRSENAVGRTVLLFGLGRKGADANEAV